RSRWWCAASTATGSISAAPTTTPAPSTSSTACAAVSCMGSSKILVTGADGFIGRALARALRDAGHDVTALGRRDGDVAEAATWEGLPKIEHVFHLAGRTFIPDSWTDPDRFIHANVAGTARALDYCRAAGAHLVFTSVSVFGSPKQL